MQEYYDVSFDFGIVDLVQIPADLPEGRRPAKRPPLRSGLLSLNYQAAVPSAYACAS